MTSPSFDTLDIDGLKVESLWIDNDALLRDCCNQLSQANAIAVDTEFMRTNTFYPKAALFQIFDGQRCYLIDPLAIEDFSPLRALLHDPQVVKVLHACSEDLEVFQSFLDCLPEPLIDTQIAAGLLHHGSSTSYATMVESVLGLKLEKGETRSDWLQRPLDSKQLHYAAQDVVYLLSVYEHLLAELERAGRMEWLKEESEALLAAARTPAPADEFYLRIKSAWKLRPQELMVLKELSTWREEQARNHDKPRNHIVHERVLWEVARRQPRNMNSLKVIEDMDHRTLRRWGQDLLTIIAQAQDLGAEHYPEALPPPLPLTQRKLGKALKGCVADTAEALQISADILVRKADFEHIVRSGMQGGTYSLPKRLQGWRRPVIGDKLLALAEQMSQRQPEEVAPTQEGSEPCQNQ